MATIDPDLRIASVTLGAADLERSSDFYERVLGIPAEARSERETVLGGEGSPAALRLVALEHPQAVPPGSTGLFHVAWLHPSRAGLAETVRRVHAAGWPLTGAADHGVSEAVYLNDPDGLGIEVYTDRPRELWEAGPDGSRLNIYTAPLDVDDLLAQFEGEPGSAIEPGTTIGHVHLKVADVARAASFYGDTGLGFAEMARMPSAAFMSAGGYHHHVGLNSWQSSGGSPAPADAPGLRAVEFRVADAAALATAAGGGAPSEQDGVGLSLRDPDGQLLVFSSG